MLHSWRWIRIRWSRYAVLKCCSHLASNLVGTNWSTDSLLHCHIWSFNILRTVSNRFLSVHSISFLREQAIFAVVRNSTSSHYIKPTHTIFHTTSVICNRTYGYSSDIPHLRSVRSEVGWSCSATPCQWHRRNMERSRVNRPTTSKRASCSRWSWWGCHVYSAAQGKFMRYW
jgi:hypothetical protein